jgi:ATP synthase F1 gamma subunit
MAKARELKARIRSVQNSRKITRTMEMVATSKLKRATERVAAARPYAARLEDVIRRLLDPQRVVDLRKVPRRELRVDHRPDDLDDVTDVRLRGGDGGVLGQGGCHSSIS